MRRPGGPDRRPPQPGDADRGVGKPGERDLRWPRPVAQDQITVPYVNTLDNLADFFTKVQKPAMFRAMRNIIMNVPPHLSDDESEDTAPGTTGESYSHGWALRNRRIKKYAWHFAPEMLRNGACR